MRGTWLIRNGEDKVKIMRKIVVIGWVLVVVLQSTFAEYRIWKDKKGHSIEAEFVCERSGLVMIKKRDGKILKLPKGKLSDADQKYLASEIPPKVELIFSKNQDRRNQSDSYAVVDMECKVTVKKKSKAVYDESLQIILLVIGRDKREKRYIMMDRAEAKFDFKQSKIFLLEGKRFRMEEYRYDNNYGTEYVGFLVVVLDKNNTVIEVKSNRKEFAAGVDLLLKIKKGKHFERNLKERKEDVSSY